MKKLLTLLFLAAAPAFAGAGDCPTPALSLPLTGCRSGTVVAAVTPVDGAVYSWTIEGGTLLSGAGTERVLIAVGSGLTLKVTATINAPSCGVQNAAGVMALRDPFVIKSISAGSGAAGAPRTISWSYDNGTPAAQLLTGTDFPAPVTLPAAARSYTYTPSLYGDKSVVLQASTTALSGRSRAAGSGSGGVASSCTSARAETRYHVDCTTPVASVEAPAATGVGIAFTARVRLAPGTSAAWTIAGGAPATAAGDSVTITPLGADPVDVRVTVSADTCKATAAKQVRVDAALGCATPPSAKLALLSSDCDKGIIGVNLTGTPPFTGAWSDGQTFTVSDRAFQRSVSNSGDYAIASLHDALCSGQGANSVKFAPGPTATVSTNGLSCLGTGADAAAVLTFTGTPPFLGEWSDSVAFNTTDTRLERKITEPANLTLKWFRDANCPGTFSGHAAFGTGGTADLKLDAPANGCLALGDPATPYALARVELTGTPPFNVVWSDGYEQGVTASPAVRTFVPPSGAIYQVSIVSARDATCDLRLLNTSANLGVTRFPVVTAPVQVCPGIAYTATVTNPSTNGAYSWRIDRGRITGGQGTQKVEFTPNDNERKSITLYADFTDPRSCTGTNALPIKIYAAPEPVTVSVSPATIKLGQTTTVTLSLDPTLSQSDVWTDAPTYQFIGFCYGSKTSCTFTYTPSVSGTLTLHGRGYPNCVAFNYSEATATLTVNP